MRASLLLPFLRRLSTEYGDRTALSFGEETWSFRRLHEEVLRLEAALLGLGAGKGTRIAVLMVIAQSSSSPCSLPWGIGSVICPISTYEPHPGAMAYCVSLTRGSSYCRTACCVTTTWVSFSETIVA